jgi:methylmalonyl-CoA mutase cobalamin-binding subunit
MATDRSTDNPGLMEEARRDVSALATAVISSLSDKSDEAGQTIRNSVVKKLVEATLRDGSFDAETLVEELRDSRVNPDQMVDIYIPETARHLGVLWSQDLVGFAKVTIATARLQGLLTLLAPPWSARPNEPGDGVSTLMILRAQDNHTLGPHVATAQLRRMGASVRLMFGPDTQTVLRVLEEEHYDLIMFTCSRTDALAPIGRMVKRIRSGSKATPPIVLGGLVLDQTDRIKEKTGVDLVTNDVRVAFKLCDNKKAKPRSVAR